MVVQLASIVHDYKLNLMGLEVYNLNEIDVCLRKINHRSIKENVPYLDNIRTRSSVRDQRLE